MKKTAQHQVVAPEATNPGQPNASTGKNELMDPLEPTHQTIARHFHHPADEEAHLRCEQKTASVSGLYAEEIHRAPAIRDPQQVDRHEMYRETEKQHSRQVYLQNLL